MRARASAPRRPIYEAALELNARINADFAYDTKATGVDDFARRRVRQAQRRLPGFRACDDRRACAASACPRSMSAAISAPCRRPARRGSPAPTPRTPGFRCGAARNSAGSASIRPTRSRRRRSYRHRARARLFRRRPGRRRHSLIGSAEARRRGRRHSGARIASLRTFRRRRSPGCGPAGRRR